MTRRFEFVRGNSAKFWEVSVSGRDVIVRYGRLGTNGQQQTNALADPAAAQKHAEGFIIAKLRKGYVECAVC